MALRPAYTLPCTRAHIHALHPILHPTLRVCLTPPSYTSCLCIHLSPSLCPSVCLPPHSVSRPHPLSTGPPRAPADLSRPVASSAPSSPGSLCHLPRAQHAPSPTSLDSQISVGPCPPDLTCGPGLPQPSTAARHSRVPRQVRLFVDSLCALPLPPKTMCSMSSGTRSVSPALCGLPTLRWLTAELQLTDAGAGAAAGRPSPWRPAV